MGGPTHTLQAAQTVVEAASAKTAVSLEVRVPLAETHSTTAAVGSWCQTYLLHLFFPRREK